MTTKRFYILTDGSEFSGKPVAMDVEELAQAEEHAETHSGGNWFWTPYNATDDNMRYAVLSEYHNE